MKRAPNPALPPAIDAAPEFAKGHVDTPPSDEALFLSRRGLLGAMAATFAVVGAEGCRRPLEKVVPYTRMPEDVIPGVASHYATVMQRRGDALGLVVESHEGRPTKIEGNEYHPSSVGGADLVAQASILELYDPERSTTPRKSGAPATWEAFEKELGGRLTSYEADQGTRLRLLMPPTISPTVVRMRAALAQRFPKARVHTWSAVADSNARTGAKVAFGEVLQTSYAFDKAKVIVSLDSDFLQTESGNVKASKLFAAGRRLRSSRDSMSRLYVVEPSRTTTGNVADHRLRLPASEIAGYAFALAAELAKLGVALGDTVPAATKAAASVKVPPKWLSVLAKEIVQNRSHAIIAVGSRQPPEVHALAHQIHVAIGAVPAVVSYTTPADPAELDVATDMKALADAIAGGKVDTLLILGGNPVYDAPADLGFPALLAKVPFSVHSSLFVDETGEKCTWHVPRAHEYESWGDASALDGTYGVQQPLIAPLYGGRSDIELLAWMAKDFAKEKSGHDAVRATAVPLILASKNLSDCGPFDARGDADCRDAASNPAHAHEFEVDREWNRTLVVGIIRRPPSFKAPSLTTGAVAAAIDGRKPPAKGTGPFEVTFAPCAKMVDGRYANNTWLQELPDGVTKLVWDNAAILSPASAKELGVENKDVVKIAVGERSITAAVWIVPGQADHSVGLTLGWGRTKAGRIGNGKGFDVYPLRTTDSLGFALGATVTKTGDEPYFFAQTQENSSTEGRPIAHEATLAEYKLKPDFAELEAPPPRALPLWSQVDYSLGHQWGMTIDLNACTGCNACVIACMAENNVPVVGKREVWRGREMHWLRIDRYYVERHEIGATAEEPAVVFEPLMCVHCEEAPCENVCPVNATNHGPEGLNEMAYNRCIGTRYCGNNCPYKVRKFNYLNWHNDSVWKETGGLPETMAMQQNPNVTVRFRGVMEKCTYCVQRIQAAKIKAKHDQRELQDNEIKTACQQTCPTDAIVFGDLNFGGPKTAEEKEKMKGKEPEKTSAVMRWAKTDRRFGLLAELGTRPRTTYLGKVRNPNPEMA
jgi:molybdopterin-containing oxidoreductase family iron-sulfur binding subunit